MESKALSSSSSEELQEFQVDAADQPVDLGDSISLSSAGASRRGRRAIPE